MTKLVYGITEMILWDKDNIGDEEIKLSFDEILDNMNVRTGAWCLMRRQYSKKNFPIHQLEDENYFAWALLFDLDEAFNNEAESSKQCTEDCRRIVTNFLKYNTTFHISDLAYLHFDGGKEYIHISISPLPNDFNSETFRIMKNKKITESIDPLRLSAHI